MFTQEQLNAEDPSSGGASRVRWARHGHASPRRTTTPTNVDVSHPVVESAVRGRNEDCSSSNPLQLVRLLVIKPRTEIMSYSFGKCSSLYFVYNSANIPQKSGNLLLLCLFHFLFLNFLVNCPLFVRKEQRSPAGMGSNLFFNCSLLHFLFLNFFDNRPLFVKKEQRSPAGMGSNLFSNCSLFHFLFHEFIHITWLLKKKIHYCFLPLANISR
jgi:hypothetical protein